MWSGRILMPSERGYEAQNAWAQRSSAGVVEQYRDG
jgi:hypothetical protein